MEGGKIRNRISNIGPFGNLILKTAENCLNGISSADNEMARWATPAPSGGGTIHAPDTLHRCCRARRRPFNRYQRNHRQKEPA
jgi:hypothetical protein